MLLHLFHFLQILFYTYNITVIYLYPLCYFRYIFWTERDKKWQGTEQSRNKASVHIIGMFFSHFVLSVLNEKLSKMKPFSSCFQQFLFHSTFVEKFYSIVLKWNESLTGWELEKFCATVIATLLTFLRNKTIDLKQASNRLLFSFCRGNTLL